MWRRFDLLRPRRHPDGHVAGADPRRRETRGHCQRNAMLVQPAGAAGSRRHRRHAGSLADWPTRSARASWSPLRRACCARCGPRAARPGPPDPWALAGAAAGLRLLQRLPRREHGTPTQVHVEEGLQPGPSCSALPAATFSVGGVIAALVGARAASAGMRSRHDARRHRSRGPCDRPAALARRLLSTAPTSPITAASDSPATGQARPAGQGAKPGRAPPPARIRVLAALALMCMLCEGVANDWSTLDLEDHTRCRHGHLPPSPYGTLRRDDDHRPSCSPIARSPGGSDRRPCFATAQPRAPSESPSWPSLPWDHGWSWRAGRCSAWACPAASPSCSAPPGTPTLPLPGHQRLAGRRRYLGYLGLLTGPAAIGWT